MNIYKLILLLSITSLFGCATGVKLDPAIKSKLDDGISINTAVSLGRPYYSGPEITIPGALSGPIGAIIAEKSLDMPTKIKNYLTAEKIEVGTIVLNEFKQQLNNRSDFSGRIRDNGKYRLKLAVLMYGIAQKHAFSTEYKPILALRSNLLDSNGRVIWSDFSRASHLNSDTLAFTKDNYFEDPEAFRTAFASAAKIVVSKAINELK